MPIQISFTRQYTYRLVGSETIDGRDCWVVEFRPAGSPEEGKLYRGRVWIDKQIYARVRSRAVQLGLEGEVLSNEEILHYAPVDAAGQPAPWSKDSFILPLQLTGQQLVSVVNATTLVERDTVLSDVTINGPDFDDQRAAVESSDVTMVRDTDKGLRYLVKKEGTEGRVVQESFDTSRLFAIAGVFYDDSLDYPLPLAGANYLDFDFRGTGNQLNLFFAGALATVNYADPRLFGSKWDLGGDAFLLAIPTTDSQYRNGVEQPGEEVQLQTGNVSVKVGRPLGNFVKLGAEYEASYRAYKTTSNTAEDFRAPSDHVRHSVRASRPHRPLRLQPGAFRQLQPALELGALGPSRQPGVLAGPEGLPAVEGRPGQVLVPAQVPEDRRRARLSSAAPTSTGSASMASASSATPASTASRPARCAPRRRPWGTSPTASRWARSSDSRRSATSGWRPTR